MPPPQPRAIAKDNADPLLKDTAALLAKASFDKGISQSLLRVAYPETLDDSRLQFPEKLLSLYHHPVFKDLSDQQKWRLSLLETVNFFSLNIHGERHLVRDLVLRCHRTSGLGNSPVVHEYLQHFIHEENAHTFMLAGYCSRYGNGVLPDHGLTVVEPQLSAPGQELLCFGRTWVLESFLDYLNRAAMRDDNIDATARQIHRIHHIDEARHMSFDKAVIRSCVDRMVSEGLQQEMAQIATLLASYSRHAGRRLCNASIYKAIGVPNPLEVTWEVAQNPQRQAVEQDWVSAGAAFLAGVGLAPSPAQQP